MNKFIPKGDLFPNHGAIFDNVLKIKMKLTTVADSLDRFNEVRQRHEIKIRTSDNVSEDRNQRLLDNILKDLQKINRTLDDANVSLTRGNYDLYNETKNLD